MCDGSPGLSHIFHTLIFQTPESEDVMNDSDHPVNGQKGEERAALLAERSSPPWESQKGAVANAR